MPETITINIPDRLYRQLTRTAELSHQPIEVIIAQSLTHSLPPLLEEIPLKYQADVYPLLEMDEPNLQKEVRGVFPAELWAEYVSLLEKKKFESLTPAEQIRLETLRREGDLLTFRKAYAAVLLKRRGYHVPTLEELEQIK